VLCLNCHGDAHARREPGQNLTPERVRKYKADWEQEVQKEATRAILRLPKVEGANWDYINHNRLFRLAHQFGIKPSETLNILPEFALLRGHNVISEQGTINGVQQWRDVSSPDYFLYEFGEGMFLYSYTSKLLEAVIQRIGVIDISGFSPAEMHELIEDGTMIFLQGRLYFKKESKGNEGAGQTRRVHGTIGGVKISGTFDGWECTSSSSKNDRPRGMKVASLVGIVSGSDLAGDNPSLQISCPGIGTYFRRNLG
jgi:hypothetical protein